MIAKIRTEKRMREEKERIEAKIVFHKQQMEFHTEQLARFQLLMSKFYEPKKGNREINLEEKWKNLVR